MPKRGQGYARRCSPDDSKGRGIDYFGALPYHRRDEVESKEQFERAVAKALAGRLPASIKTKVKHARPYVEGRGFRFSIDGLASVSNVIAMVGIKLAQ